MFFGRSAQAPSPGHGSALRIRAGKRSPHRVLQHHLTRKSQKPAPAISTTASRTVNSPAVTRTHDQENEGSQAEQAETGIGYWPKGTARNSRTFPAALTGEMTQATTRGRAAKPDHGPGDTDPSNSVMMSQAACAAGWISGSAGRGSARCPPPNG